MSTAQSRDIHRHTNTTYLQHISRMSPSAPTQPPTYSTFPENVHAHKHHHLPTAHFRDISMRTNTTTYLQHIPGICPCAPTPPPTYSTFPGYPQAHQHNHLPTAHSRDMPMRTNTLPSQVTAHTRPLLPTLMLVTSCWSGVGTCIHASPSGDWLLTPVRTITCEQNTGVVECLSRSE